jgi:hypothetical protein
MPGERLQQQCHQPETQRRPPDAVGAEEGIKQDENQF